MLKATAAREEANERRVARLAACPFDRSQMGVVLMELSMAARRMRSKLDGYGESDKAAEELEVARVEFMSWVAKLAEFKVKP